MASKDEIEREQERNRGILNGADRKWLLSPREEYIEEHSRQYWGQRRDKVRERTRNAILDFSLLFDHMTIDDWEAVSGSRPSPSVWFDDPAFEAGVRDTLASMLLIVGGRSLFEGVGPVNPTAERLLHDAFERLAWLYMYDLERFDFTIEAEQIHWRDLKEKLESGDELSVDELSKLLIAKQDEVDTGALQDEVRNQLAEGEE